MDPVAALGLGATPEVTTTAQQGLGGLDSDAFMQLMVAQLRYQDPLAPTDTNGLMQQTSMLAQTEMLTQVSAMQQQLLGLQRASMATDLIGEHVEGLGADGGTVSGVVESVRFDAAGPVLVMDGGEVALDDATGIGAATAADGAPTTTEP